MSYPPSTASPTSGPSRRERFEEAVAPPKSNHGFVSLREEDQSPTPSTSSSRAAATGSDGYYRPKTLQEFRNHDKERKKRLKGLYDSLWKNRWFSSEQAPSPATATSSSSSSGAAVYPKTDDLRKEYLKELYRSCCGGKHADSSKPTFENFQHFVEHKEEDLWEVFNRLDVNNDMLLGTGEITSALSQHGIQISPENLRAMMREMDTDNSGNIDFQEWRDFLLLLPRTTNVSNIVDYWQAYSYAPRLSASIATQDADVTLWGKPRNTATAAAKASSEKGKAKAVNQEDPSLQASSTAAGGSAGDGGSAPSTSKADGKEDDAEDEDHGIFEGSGAYLLAGGLAGAVSRTATAPFDRLKVYLINTVKRKEASIPDLSKTAANPVGAAKELSKASSQGMSVFNDAVKTLYREGGVRAFFIGNGLNILKIFPESAVKFWSYEYSKRWFARNVDQCHVADISSSSRFVAGGIGGVTSQFLIYPLETWKTRVMSSTSSTPGALKGNALYLATARDMFKSGGLRTYYRGLTMGIVGVFPYSAIDMSLFAAFKKAYIKFTGDEEPGALGSLTFGAVSGGLGATSVYPLNLLRTRMQSQGTPAHPQRYSGWRDVARTCYRNEGIRGFYKGLLPTLLKVSPSIGISWVVYEYSSRILVKHD